MLPLQQTQDGSTTFTVDPKCPAPAPLTLGCCLNRDRFYETLISDQKVFGQIYSLEFKAKFHTKTALYRIISD
jgi:hypothetical protein